MTLDPHPVGREDVEAFFRALETAFGSVADDAEIASASTFFDNASAIGVSDRGRIVATAGAHAMEMTLPAGPGHTCPLLPVPGVTWVGVAPTHRRQGLLTKMMQHQLSDFRDRGHPLAILTASEGPIYGRFGYEPAQFMQSVAIDRRRASFRAVDPTAGRLWLIDAGEARKVLPGIHDRARRRRPAELARSPQWWDRHLSDAERHRGGGEGRFYAVHESGDGEADGWVSYRFHEDWEKGHRVEVADLVAAEPAVAADLWRYALNLDLAGEITVERRPMDEPLRWLLEDPRQVRTTYVGDHVWVRIIDVAGALAARGYSVEGGLVLEIAGEGRFVLETGFGAGMCRKAQKGEKADLVLGLAELGGIYLGGVRPSELAAAGRVTEVRPGALAWADLAFAGQVAPFCSIGF